MARTRYVVDGTWTEINGAIACTITFDCISRKGHVQFNEVPDETPTILKLHAQPNDQIEQNENKSVYVRSDQEGYEIVVDTVGNA